MGCQDFIHIVTKAFLPFLETLGFNMDTPWISGKFYRASFSGPANVVSISYEPGDKSLFLVVFSKDDNGELSDIDNRTKTPRLADLNSRYMHVINNDERKRNEDTFALIHASSQEEVLLLKYAKELSLVLPKYLNG